MLGTFSEVFGAYKRFQIVQLHIVSALSFIISIIILLLVTVV